jgi:hypothetical protein
VVILKGIEPRWIPKHPLSLLVVVLVLLWLHSLQLLLLCTLYLMVTQAARSSPSPASTFIAAATTRHFHGM